jgi:hypothetical protein
MNDIPIPNPEHVSPTQAALAVELAELEEQAITLVKQVDDHKIVRSVALTSMVTILRKAHDLGGRAEWYRRQAAQVKAELGEAVAERPFSNSGP